MHSEVYLSRSADAKEKKYLVWTSDMDNCLTKVLAEQVKKGNKVDNALKPAAFAAAVKALNDKFGNDLTKANIKNRLKTWRKQFGVLKELLAHKGFVWNESQKMVVADSSVWNDYIRAHPDARIFRAKPIENYDELFIILGNNQAIASYSDDITEIDVNLTYCKEEPDLAIMSKLQTDENQTKCTRWTEEMDLCLGRILADQVKKGLKVDNVLRTEGYNTAVSAVNAKFGLHLTKSNIRNRLKTWKKQYEVLKRILSHSGFKWDETRKMITANDSTWSEYIRTHPDARSFRARVFYNYDQLCTFFDHYEFLDCNESEPCDEPVEDLGICPVNYDSIVTNQAKNIRWTTDMDSCLSAALVEQIKLGNGSNFDNKLKPAALEAAVSAVNDKFQLYLMKEHVKHRLKTWKKQYDILKEVLHQTGFKWDERRKMVIANDSVWNEYIKKNPDARLLKGRVIRNFDELCIIIGHSDPLDVSMNGALASMLMTTEYDMTEGQGTNHHGTSRAKEKSKPVTWTNEIDRCLTEVLVKQVMLGNKLEKNFKTSAYITAQIILNERFGLNLTKENIATRLRAWQKQYDLLKEMLSQWGFEWDEGHKMIVATDSEWSVFIKKHPHARHLQGKSIENFNELGMIVGNEQTIGNWSLNLERLDVNLIPTYEEEHSETPLLMLANEEISGDNTSDDEVQGSSEQTRARPSSSNSKQPSKRRRTSDVMIEMMSVMAADISRIANALTESNKTVCLEEVVEKVQNMPDFDDDLIIEACEYLCFDEKRALMFLKLDERLRKKWLLKRLRGQGM